jgi:hypothetical protein
MCTVPYVQDYYFSSRISSVSSCWSQVPRSTAMRARGRVVVNEKLCLTNKMWTLTALMVVEISNRNS